ncbi:MAG: NTP transferase domain-containing protein [Spirochaetaceae bacterium]|nr:MAG: NTP transferase domain-containing protein [Spirochaetaceae bacterium]
MDTWKMTLPWEQSTIVEHSVQTALSVCSRVVLVVGFRAEELEERFRNWPRIKVVRNQDYQAGMFSSVQRGAAAVGENCFFLALADMPGVSETVYKVLLEWKGRLGPVFATSGVAHALIPQYKGKKGHPLLLSPKLRGRILTTDFDKTLRDVLSEVPTVLLPVDEPGILHDIDTQSDYSAWSPQDQR